MCSVPSRVVELIETFDRDIEAYHSQQYNETQLRREFIDPFFGELGWDVTNKAGYAQAYKDVIHEDAIKVGGATKAPDYCFRIGGFRKFFLEAKKPSVNIKGDPHPAYQLRRYAWSAKLPLSILTDFEEFAVYDCQTRPRQTDKADTARIMYFTYKHYPDKWAKIADVFSRDAILKGSFDKFAVATKGKRGTTTVDIELLAEIEKWRKMLARIIALRNRTLTKNEINFAVQRTIDRILFLRMCEDRGIEQYQQLQSIISGDRTYPRLCEIFEKADQKYNSGLFHFQDEPDRATPPDVLTPNITIDDKDLKYILHSLYYPLCPYEFSVLPPEILDNVYEQFLGSVITISGAHRADVVPKPEVKKAGGVYYTPSYIVVYIVKNTVGKLIEGKTPRQIANLKILDPACGSGSFLLGAYTYLLDYHRDWYVDNDPQKYPKKIYQGRGGQWYLTNAEKKRILLNNIFGVDIDSQAVEVTKLSLLLKVLEGENAQTLENQYRLFHERALPDLANNIKCGNSLISSDFFDNLDPESITEELRQRINAFDWHTEFPQIFSGKNPGFDAIIGNPPYGGLIPKNTRNYYARKYPNSCAPRDTYMFFIDKGLRLSRIGGLFGMITPNTWMQIFSAKKFRQHLLNNFSINQVLHFKKKVFPRVTVNCEILIVSKRKPKQNRITIFIRLPQATISHCIAQDRWIAKCGDIISVLQDEKASKLSDKLIRLSQELYVICDVKNGAKPFEVGKGKPPQTKEILRKKPYVTETKVDDTFKPLLRGSLIRRYLNLWHQNYWISYGPWLAAQRDPKIFFDVPKKVIVRQTGECLIGTIADNTFVCRDNLHLVIPKKSQCHTPEYILALLNSKLIDFYYRSMNPESGETFAQVKASHLKRLPLRIIDFDNPNPVEPEPNR